MSKTQVGNWNSFGQTVDSQVIHLKPTPLSGNPSQLAASRGSSDPPTKRDGTSKGDTMFYQRLKKWFNFWKSLMSITPLNFVPMTPSKLPLFMRFVFHSIEGLKLPEPKDFVSRNTLIIKATFFQIQAGRFFGRTMTTKPIFLYKKNNGLLGSKEEKAFYYWTRATNPGEIIMALEFVGALYNEDTQVISRREPLGWGLVVNPFKNLRRKENKMLYGTPRLLFSYANQPRLDPTDVSFTFTSIAAPGFRCVSHLFDDLIICSTDDILPGVENDFLPLMVEEDSPPPGKNPIPRPGADLIEITSTIPLIQTFKIFVNDINISIGVQQIKEILVTAREFQEENFRLKNTLSKPSIKHIQLTTAFHNGWTAINRQKFENFVILQPLEDPSKPNETEKIFTYLGNIGLDGCFLHPFSLLVFQLEAVVDIPIDPRTREDKKIILGWIPLFLPNTTSSNSELEVSQAFILGPGKSITNEDLFVFEGAKTLDSVIQPSQGPHVALNARVILGDHLLSKLGRKTGANQTDDEVINSIIASKDREKDELRKEYEKRLQAQAHMDARPLRTSQEISAQPYKENKREFAPHTGKYEEDILKIRTSVISRNAVLEVQQKIPYAETIPPNDIRLLNAIANNRYQGKSLKTDQDWIYERELSRAEKMYLLQSGFEGLIGRNMFEPAEVNMVEELADSLKASTVTLQFMAIKYMHGAPGLPGDHQSLVSIGSRIHALPQNIHINFEFFDFPLFKSDCLKVEMGSVAEMYVNPQDAHALSRVDNVGAGDPRRAVYRLEVDPSHQGGLPGRQRKFIQYLAVKSLIINIYDANSLMFFGSAKVNLRGLLRSGQPVVSIKKEVVIYDPETLVEMGALQLLIENAGRLPDMPELVKDDPFYVDDISEKEGNRTHHLRSFHPIKLEHSQLMKSSSPPTGISDIKDPNLSKKLRIQKYKGLEQMARSAMGQTGNSVFLIGPHNHTEVIREKEKIKWNKISMDSAFSTEKEIRIMATEGESSIIPFEIKNSIKGEQPLSILICDQTEEKLVSSPKMAFGMDGRFSSSLARTQRGVPEAEDRCELSVINDPTEWNFWCKLKGYPEPQEFSIITQNSKLILTRGEQLMILFKYFAVLDKEESEEIDGDGSRIPVKKNGVQGSPDGPSTSVLKRTKNFRVTIADTQTGQVLWGFHLVVCLTRSSVDHYYLCHRPENKFLELAIPWNAFTQDPRKEGLPNVVAQSNFGVEEALKGGEWKESMMGGGMGYSNSVFKRPFIRLSNSGTQIKWEENGKLTLVMKAPPSTYTYRVKLYAYRDPFLSRSLCCWTFEINSYTSIVEEFALGVPQQLSCLYDVGMDQKFVQLFSSHPFMVSFPPEFRKPHVLVPGASNKISMLVKLLYPKDSVAKVHLIDTKLGELLAAWLVKIRTLPPKIQKTHRFHIHPSQKEKPISILFTNPLGTSSVFEFELSNPEIIQVEFPKITVNYGETKPIFFRIGHLDLHNGTGSFSTYLFITLAGDILCETHQIILVIQ